MFDKIIEKAKTELGLGDQAGGVVSALLGLIANPATGGFGGFIQKFHDAGLGAKVDSWISNGDNEPVSADEVETALGADSLDQIASQSGVERGKVAAAIGGLAPTVVDALTPDGTIPDQAGILAKVTGVLKEYGGAVGAAILGGFGAATALASDAADKIGDAAGATLDVSKAVVGKGAEAVGDAAGATLDAGKAVVGKGADVVGDAAGATLDAGKAVVGAAGDALGKVGDVFDGGGGDSGGFLKWLIPLILVGLLIGLGYLFCGTKSTPVATVPNVNKPPVTNSNQAVKKVDSSFKLEAKDGKYFASGVVADQKTFDEIKAALEAQFGAGNVDLSGLKIDASAKPFEAGWWANFSKLLPSLKDWKTGTLAFAGSAITTASGLPQAAIDALKSLFTGWKLPVSLAGAEEATKQANAEALKELGEAKTLEELITALNVSIINFASGKSDIPADAKPILEKAAEVLKKQPDGAVVEIGGYTDNKGNAEANKKLSQSRADAVKAALVALGVKEASLKAVGYGDANPVGDNETEDGRFSNRRIEYKKADGSAPTATK